MEIEIRKVDIPWPILTLTEAVEFNIRGRSVGAAPPGASEQNPESITTDNTPFDYQLVVDVDIRIDKEELNEYIDQAGGGAPAHTSAPAQFETLEELAGALMVSDNEAYDPDSGEDEATFNSQKELASRLRDFLRKHPPVNNRDSEPVVTSKFDKRDWLRKVVAPWVINGLGEPLPYGIIRKPEPKNFVTPLERLDDAGAEAAETPDQRFQRRVQQFNARNRGYWVPGHGVFEVAPGSGLLFGSDWRAEREKSRYQTVRHPLTGEMVPTNDPTNRFAQIAYKHVIDDVVANNRPEAIAQVRELLGATGVLRKLLFGRTAEEEQQRVHYYKDASAQHLVLQRGMYVIHAVVTIKLGNAGGKQDPWTLFGYLALLWQHKNKTKKNWVKVPSKTSNEVWLLRTGLINLPHVYKAIAQGDDTVEKNFKEHLALDLFNSGEDTGVSGKFDHIDIRDNGDILFFYGEKAYVVTDPGKTPLTKGQKLSPEEYAQAFQKYGNEFKVDEANPDQFYNPHAEWEGPGWQVEQGEGADAGISIKPVFTKHKGKLVPRTEKELTAYAKEHTKASCPECGGTGLDANGGRCPKCRDIKSREAPGTEGWKTSPSLGTRRAYNKIREYESETREQRLERKAAEYRAAAEKWNQSLHGDE